jgi:hypothetical protein
MYSTPTLGGNARIYYLVMPSDEDAQRLLNMHVKPPSLEWNALVDSLGLPKKLISRLISVVPSNATLILPSNSRVS